MINIYRFKIKLINKEKMQKSEMEPKIEKEQVDFRFPLRATFIGITSRLVEKVVLLIKLMQYI